MRYTRLFYEGETFCLDSDPDKFAQTLANVREALANGGGLAEVPGEFGAMWIAIYPGVPLRIAYAEEPDVCTCGTPSAGPFKKPVCRIHADTSKQ